MLASKTPFALPRVAQYHKANKEGRMLRKIDRVVAHFEVYFYITVNKNQTKKKFLMQKTI